MGDVNKKSLTEKGSSQGAGVQVISRAALILRAVGQNPHGFSLGELSRKVNLAKSTVQRIVNALSEEGFLIAPSTSGSVRIGPEIMRLASENKFDVAKILRPHIRWLADETGETVDVSIIDAGSAMFVDQIQGSHRLRAVSAAGERFPLFDNAPGTMLLALIDPKAATSALSLSLQEHSDVSIDNQELFWKMISKARKQGYAIDEEQHSEGICAVGTGVIDPLGKPVAISIPTPITRFPHIREKLIQSILLFRERISTDENFSL